MGKKAIILLFLIRLAAWGQTGNFYITNYSISDYGGTDQNWSGLQDEFGRIFVANNNGILLYSGKIWQLLKLSNDGRCFSLDKDKNCKIFAGGENEFGYLDVSRDGTMIYHSLSKDLPGKDKVFGIVWAIHCINDEVFFCSNEKIFWYKNGKIKSFSPESEGFHTFFKVGDHLFVREKQVGFKVFIDGELKKISATEEFADQRVDFILPLKNNLYWVGTRNKGMFLLVYDPEHPRKSIFSKIVTPLDNWMAKNELYCGVRINENTYALGSLKGGILITDKNFKTIKTITDKDGLIDNGVKNICVDQNKNLWLALNNGISFVELSTPVTRWTKNDGIKGVIEAAAKCEGKLYIASDKGLQVLNPRDNKFTETPISDYSFSLFSIDQTLLVGTEYGLYSLSKGKSRLLFDRTVYCIFPNESDRSVLYLGTDSGISIVRYHNNSITELKKFNDWSAVRFAARSKEGLLAFATPTNGIFLLDKNKNNKVVHLTQSKGLPSLTDNSVFSYKGELMLGTESGFYKITNDKDGPRAEILSELNSHGFQDKTISKAMQINDDLWFHYIREVNISGRDFPLNIVQSLNIDDGKISEKQSMLRRIKDVDATNFFLDSNHVYISTNNGLYCYDIGMKPVQQPYYTFISKLSFKNDSTHQLFEFSKNLTNPKFEIPFTSNEIEVIPSASDYYDAAELKYTWYLDGKDNAWCNWSKTPVIIYNNLHEGNYTLHLKSMNLLGQEGKEITSSFTILPPWYRSLWAYMLYLLAGVGAFWAAIRIYSRRLVEQNIKLENIITERTKTVAHQKEEIEHKNREITDSINYAKRIQDAILPSVKEIKKSWANTFVFFQPKDIVSGDFYWYHKINADEFLLAVADCTGHGVPGGFMSMICSDKLNEAAGISKSPSELLHYANNAIKLALKQNEDENTTRDGMEMALVRVNTQNQKIWYTGANRPLWIIRKDSNELEEIKPTKASVASNTSVDFQYQSHEFQLNKGDSLYMSSDGYPDQFGGPKGKKYMTANFKKFILSIKDEVVQMQHNLIKSNIENWMKGFEQVDDLLVIGIKL